REDRAHVRRGRRVRLPPAFLLRLQREPESLARIDAPARRGSDAQGRPSNPEIRVSSGGNFFASVTALTCRLERRFVVARGAGWACSPERKSKTCIAELAR